MTDPDQFLSDLQDLCERHGVRIQGICASEGINGEILVLPDHGEIVHEARQQDGMEPEILSFPEGFQIAGHIRAKKFAGRLETA